MYVKSVFLNGDLKEEVYVHLPPGFAIPGTEGKECQVELHAQGNGLRAKPTREGHLPAGQWRKHPAGGCLCR
jgi:hypothetical protein